MPLTTTIQQEAQAGFPRVRGARLQAVVPLVQDVLDRMLARLPVQVEILDRNSLVVSYRGVRVTAEVVGVTPDLTLLLSTSWLSRAALWGALAWNPALRKYLAQQDGLVRVLCGRIPAVAKHRHWWQHLSAIQVRTSAGRILFHLEAHV